MSERAMTLAAIRQRDLTETWHECQATRDRTVLLSYALDDERAIDALVDALHALVDDRDAGYGDAAEGCSVAQCGYCCGEMVRGYVDGAIVERYPHTPECPIAQGRALLNRLAGGEAQP